MKAREVYLSECGARADGLLKISSYLLGEFTKISSPKLSVEQATEIARAEAAIAQVYALLLVNGNLEQIVTALRAKQRKPLRKSKKT